MSDELTLKFSDETSGCSVIFDDDGRVVYAYLLDPEGQAVGDVWLYNRCRTPESPEWASPDKMPFANPSEFAKSHEDIAPVVCASDIRIEWSANEPNGPTVFIFVCGTLWAVLSKGMTPGWCLMAKKDGPLALTMASAPALPHSRS